MKQKSTRAIALVSLLTVPPLLRAGEFTTEPPAAAAPKKPGDGPDSVFAQTRYERSAPALTGGGRGREYHAGYPGLQYFICGDKLKLLAGAEYAHLNGGGNGGGFEGLTVLTGIRLSF